MIEFWRVTIVMATHFSSGTAPRMGSQPSGNLADQKSNDTSMILHLDEEHSEAMRVCLGVSKKHKKIRTDMFQPKSISPQHPPNIPKPFPGGVVSPLLSSACRTAAAMLCRSVLKSTVGCAAAS